MKTLRVSLAVLALAVSAGVTASLSPAPNPVTLLEQNIKLKLKLTTIALPEVNPGNEISARFDTTACRVTTRDLLESLGFSPTAELIARVTAEWQDVPLGEPLQPAPVDQWRPIVQPPATPQPAELRLSFVVRSGSIEADVTEMLCELLPVHEPIGCLGMCAKAQSVAKGEVVASVAEGVDASLHSTFFARPARQTRIPDLTDNGVNLGDLVLDCASLSKANTALRVRPDGVHLRVASESRVMGKAQLNDSRLRMSIPAVVDGKITARGHVTISTRQLAEFMDVEELMRILNHW